MTEVTIPKPSHSWRSHTLPSRGRNYEQLAEPQYGRAWKKSSVDDRASK